MGRSALLYQKLTNRRLALFFKGGFVLFQRYFPYVRLRSWSFSLAFTVEYRLHFYFQGFNQECYQFNLCPIEMDESTFHLPLRTRPTINASALHHFQIEVRWLCDDQDTIKIRWWWMPPGIMILLLNFCPIMSWWKIFSWHLVLHYQWSPLFLLKFCIRLICAPSSSPSPLLLQVFLNSQASFTMVNCFSCFHMSFIAPLMWITGSSWHHQSLTQFGCVSVSLRTPFAPYRTLASFAMCLSSPRSCSSASIPFHGIHWQLFDLSISVPYEYIPHTNSTGEIREW